MNIERKCVFCQGTAKIRFEDLNLFNGKVVLKGQPYYKCLKCGKDFVTSNQLRDGEEELKTKFLFERDVISTGRSLAITLPKDLAEYYGIKKGSRVKIIPENKGTIKIKV